MGKQFSQIMFLLLVAIVPSTAWADEVLDEFQITCDKQLHYFSLRTLAMDDRRFVSSNEHELRSERQNGLFRPNVLSKHPFTCDLGSSSVSVEVFDYSSKDGRGECGGRGEYAVTIKQNGADLYKFSPYGSNRCLNPVTHVIEVLDPYALRDCTLPDASGQATCKYLSK